MDSPDGLLPLDRYQYVHEQGTVDVACSTDLRPCTTILPINEHVGHAQHPAVLPHVCRCASAIAASNSDSLIHFSRTIKVTQ